MTDFCEECEAIEMNASPTNKYKHTCKGENMHDYLMQFFKYDHLPEHLQAVSKPFADLANSVIEAVPSNPERTVALRKLLEAKDCAVRAVLFK